MPEAKIFRRCRHSWTRPFLAHKNEEVEVKKMGELYSTAETEQPKNSPWSRFRCSSSTTNTHIYLLSLALALSIHNKQYTNPVCARRVNHLVCSLPLHRHSYIGFTLVFTSSIHNKHTSLSRNQIMIWWGHGCIFTYQLKYWWDTYHFKNTYSPITLANISSINVVSIFRCSSSTNNPVYTRRVDSSTLVFSLSSHRHSYIGLVFDSHFTD
jgi:hypothetical protein